MAEIKWIKLTTDMFDNRKIKHLRRLPDGNSIVLIWVMLLTMAGRCNAGGMIFLTENIPYTPKMLADELDFEESTVVLALNALRELNMISSVGDHLAIAGWEEYQNIESLDRIREQNRLRKQKQREREKLPELDVSRDCHVTVTQSHATDKEEEKERRNNKAASPFEEILSEIEPEELRSLYREFIKMRTLNKSPMTAYALKLLISKVKRLEPNSTERQMMMLKEAIESSWKSVYKLKDGNKTSAPKNSVNNKRAVSCGDSTEFGWMIIEEDGES